MSTPAPLSAENDLSPASPESTEPPESPKRRGRPRSEAAADAVLDAAYQLCAAEGLKGATVQAIAVASGVSKMTIYKWWESRLPLLVDAFLRQTLKVTPLSEALPPVKALHAHAQRYLAALHGDQGRVMVAVMSECMAEQGSHALFVQRYLGVRRELGIRVIGAGQRDGSIPSKRPPQALFDQIYGTMFYRYQFDLPGLNKAFVKSLVDQTLGLAED